MVILYVRAGIDHGCSVLDAHDQFVFNLGFIVGDWVSRTLFSLVMVMDMMLISA